MDLPILPALLSKIFLLAQQVNRNPIKISADTLPNPKVTPNKLGRSIKAAASWNSVYGGRGQVYGNINHTGSVTSINIFSFCTSVARLE